MLIKGESIVYVISVTGTIGTIVFKLADEAPIPYHVPGFTNDFE